LSDAGAYFPTDTVEDALQQLGAGTADYLLTDGSRAGGTAQVQTFDNYLRATTAIYRRYYHLSMAAFNPGASGATWTAPDANTVGGWQLNAAGETLQFAADIHADWDAASDIDVEIYFAKNTAGGSTDDTVDLKLICYYNGVGEVATKTQTVEVATTVDDDAQYTVYKVEFNVNFDEVDNVVQVGDLISFVMNLETDTSECDDIIILQGGASIYYHTTHIGMESGDV